MSSLLAGPIVKRPDLLLPLMASILYFIGSLVFIPGSVFLLPNMSKSLQLASVWIYIFGCYIFGIAGLMELAALFYAFYYQRVEQDRLNNNQLRYDDTRNSINSNDGRRSTVEKAASTSTSTEPRIIEEGMIVKTTAVLAAESDQIPKPSQNNNDKGAVWSIMKSLIAVVYCLGGLLFTAGSLLFIPDIKMDRTGTLVFRIGSCFYLTGSTLSIWQVWRSLKTETTLSGYLRQMMTGNNRIWIQCLILYIFGSISFIIGGIYFEQGVDLTAGAIWWIAGSIFFTGGSVFGIVGNMRIHRQSLPFLL